MTSTARSSRSISSTWPAQNRRNCKPRPTCSKPSAKPAASPSSEIPFTSQSKFGKRPLPKSRRPMGRARRFLRATWQPHSIMDPQSKLRMAPTESAEDLARRVEHEQRATGRQRESELDQSLAPFRVGSVPYLNAVPLTRGLEDEITFATPAKLAEMLQRDELDAALVSVVEVLFHDRYDILDGIAIASLGEVQSVLLAHRKPLAEATEIFCDTASLTSVELLRVLLAERGLKPEFKPLPKSNSGQLPDFALLIGDPALDLFRLPGEHQTLDLGAAWHE